MKRLLAVLCSVAMAASALVQAAPVRAAVMQERNLDMAKDNLAARYDVSGPTTADELRLRDDGQLVPRTTEKLGTLLDTAIDTASRYVATDMTAEHRILTPQELRKNMGPPMRPHVPKPVQTFSPLEYYPFEATPYVKTEEHAPHTASVQPDEQASLKPVDPSTSTPAQPISKYVQTEITPYKSKTVWYHGKFLQPDASLLRQSRTLSGTPVPRLKKSISDAGKFIDFKDTSYFGTEAEHTSSEAGHQEVDHAVSADALTPQLTRSGSKLDETRAPKVSHRLHHDKTGKPEYVVDKRGVRHRKKTVNVDFTPQPVDDKPKTAETVFRRRYAQMVAATNARDTARGEALEAQDQLHDLRSSFPKHDAHLLKYPSWIPFLSTRIKQVKQHQAAITAKAEELPKLQQRVTELTQAAKGPSDKFDEAWLASDQRYKKIDSEISMWDGKLAQQRWDGRKRIENWTVKHIAAQKQKASEAGASA